MLRNYFQCNPIIVVGSGKDSIVLNRYSDFIFVDHTRVAFYHPSVKTQFRCVNAHGCLLTLSEDSEVIIPVGSVIIPFITPAEYMIDGNLEWYLSRQYELLKNRNYISAVLRRYEQHDR